MKLGIIAGNKLFPIIFSKLAKVKDKDLELVAICFHSETDSRINSCVDKALWLKVGEFNKLIEIIKREELRKLVMVGQISPGRIFQRKQWDDKMLDIVKNIEDFRPHSVFHHLVMEIEKLGVEFLNSTIYLEQYLAKEGVMNNLEILDGISDDIAFGTQLISKYVELDVGQSIVVKNKTVIALEGLDGTDKTILRAYRLGGEGCVVLKFSKRDQDFRFDVPVVGLNTLKLLKRVRAAALVLEVDGVIILEKDKFLRQASRWHIPIVGKNKLISNK